ncbi:MAG TPA: glycosyltransferase [Methylomirabilota bacterium]|jgi:glycosyltransferase involved in cell wall biosynthesis|nr:glycosyltransferase [Methylomirabilota bacterium]
MAIRVLYAHHVDQMSGAEQSLRLLLRHLDPGRVVPVFAGPAAGPFPDALVREGIPVLAVPFGPLRDLGGVVRSVRAVCRVIRRHRIDLVHGNGPRTNVVAGLAARWTGIPAIWHVRNLLYGRMRDVDRMLAALPSAIICNSDAIRERFRGSRAWRKTVTILNAVDTRQFNPAVPREPFRRELGIADGEPAIGIVGRIGLGKGHTQFVEAAIRLVQAGSPGQFLVVGEPLFAEDAWRAEALQARIKDARLEDRIRLTGPRRDIPLVMRGLDILVLASDAEPCGRVLFEAMASGTAIVATNTGGTPEIVRDGREGILVPPRDPGSLARAVDRLIADPDLRASLGRGGAERARQAFTVEQHVARTLEVYTRVLGGAPPAAGAP